MKKVFLFNLLVIAAMFITLAGTPQISVQAYQTEVVQDNIRQGMQYVPGELVVGFKKGKTASAYSMEASVLARGIGGTVVRFSGQTALFSFAPDANVLDLAKQMAGNPGVQFAEPNYVFSIPEGENPQSDKYSPANYVIRQTHAERGEIVNMVVPVEALMSMRKSPKTAQTVYPSDPYLWWNEGWGAVAADVVWPNNTASALVCVIDTGVDYTHPDLIKVVSGTKKPQVLKGYDFVNDDADPMDDNGHGTHVAGIISAVQNNKQGMSGVSTGQVLAVKVLTAQGWGTTFDIASGITYCANNSKAKVINLSLGGPGYSQFLENAVAYATVTKGKLLVAAAGNDGRSNYCRQWVDGYNGNPVDGDIQDDDPNTPEYDGEWQRAGDDRAYPAGFSKEALWTNWYNPDYSNLPDYTQTSPDDPRYASLCEFWDVDNNPSTEDIMHPGYPAVFSVASQGNWQPGDDNDGDGNPDWWWPDYTCKSDFSNYGEWVNATAPGLSIFSTTPWDKPFFLNIWHSIETRYAELDGTSMASPFVAATFARDWGYHPTFTQSQILDDIWNKSWFVWDYDDDGEDNDSGCWPESMDASNGNYAIRTNVAVLLERGIVYGSAWDSSSALPLTGGTLQVYQGTTLKGSAVFSSWSDKAGYWEPDPTRKYMWFESGTDILNLPAGGPDCQYYTPKISKAGYTATPQEVFQHMNHNEPVQVCPGWWVFAGRAAVPPKSKNFDVVTTWFNYLWEGTPVDTTYFGPDPDNWQTDLDSNVWLPDTNGSIPTAPPWKFAVGPEGWDYGLQMEGETLGSLTAFPFARWKHDGGVPYYGENLSSRFEDITIKVRPGFTNLPYYGGNYASNFYAVAITDYGQSWDHDAIIGTPNIPLLGIYRIPWVYVWKDGKVIGFTDLRWDYVTNNWREYVNPNPPYNITTPCNEHWWRPLDIISPASGSYSIRYYDGVSNPILCGDVNPDGDWGTNDGIEPYTRFTSINTGKP